jgi:hypothetical protein
MVKKDTKAKAAEKKARTAAKQDKKAKQKEKKVKTKGKEDDSDAEDVDLEAVLAEYAKQVGLDLCEHRVLRAAVLVCLLDSLATNYTYRRVQATQTDAHLYSKSSSSKSQRPPATRPSRAPLRRSSARPPTPTSSSSLVANSSTAPWPLSSTSSSSTTSLAPTGAA